MKSKSNSRLRKARFSQSKAFIATPTSVIVFLIIVFFSTQSVGATLPPAESAPNLTPTPGATSESSPLDTTPVMPAIPLSKISIAVEQNGKPLEGADVSINGQSSKTASTGMAAFENVMPGEQSVSVNHNGKTSQFTINVANQNDSESTQKFEVKIEKDNGSILLTVILGTLAATAIAVGALFAYKKRGGASKPSNP